MRTLRILLLLLFFCACKNCALAQNPDKIQIITKPIKEGDLIGVEIYLKNNTGKPIHAWWTWEPECPDDIKDPKSKEKIGMPGSTSLCVFLEKDQEQKYAGKLLFNPNWKGCLPNNEIHFIWHYSSEKCPEGF
jgi:hypothetical protein